MIYGYSNMINMKKVIFLAMLVASFSLISCEKEQHAENLKVTTYPDFSFENGTASSTFAWQLGDAWVDPGFSALLDGEDIAGQMEVDSSEVNVNVPGIYTVTYSYTNKDGFENSFTRTVVVYDIANANSTDISGTYTDCTVIDLPGTADETDYKKRCTYDMKITKGPGVGLFYVSDLFAGMWDKYREYGSAYAFKALIQLNKDNSISLLDVDVIWPYACVPNGVSTYDPATGDIVINWFWAGWGDELRTIYKK